MRLKTNKKIRNKFSKLIERTKIYPQSIVWFKLVPIIWFLYRNMPKKIYKFRCIDDKSISFFEKDEIWCSSPEYFNDEHEKHLYVNKDKIITSLKERFEDTKEEYDIDSLCNFIIKDLVKSMKIACFSENITSTSMWTHYADSNKGFAIEYSSFDIFKLTMSLDNFSTILLPVIYVEEKYNASEFFYRQLYNIILSTHNINKLYMPIDRIGFYKIFLHKSHNWEYENEWRLFAIDKNPSKQLSNGYSINISAKAIYLGRDIKDQDKEKIIAIANKKQIPIYQMGIDTQSKSYDYKFEKITN